MSEIEFQQNIAKLEHLKERIESMNKKQHIEILKILKRFPDVKLNENKSGVYINILFLPEETIRELEKYIQYIEEQESAIMTVETQKNEYKNTYFTNKQDKEEPALMI
jgi:Ni,Fe-hydrogenase III component G